MNSANPSWEQWKRDAYNAEQTRREQDFNKSMQSSSQSASSYPNGSANNQSGTNGQLAQPHLGSLAIGILFIILALTTLGVGIYRLRK